MDPKETQDEKSFLPQNYNKNKIKDEPTDIVGMEIEKQKWMMLIKMKEYKKKLILP